MLSGRLATTLRHFIRAAIADGIDAPVKPSDAEIARRVEAFVRGTPPSFQRRFRTLLRALWALPIVLHLKTFPQLQPQQQHRLLVRWANSRWYYAWFSFDVLKSLCLLIYYSDPGMERHVEYQRPCDTSRGWSVQCTPTG